MNDTDTLFRLLNDQVDHNVRPATNEDGKRNKEQGTVSKRNRNVTATGPDRTASRNIMTGTPRRDGTGRLLWVAAGSVLCCCIKVVQVRSRRYLAN